MYKPQSIKGVLSRTSDRETGKKNAAVIFDMQYKISTKKSSQHCWPFLHIVL